MVYANPVFTEESILAFYRTASIDKYLDATSESIRINMRRYLDRLVRYSGIKKGRLLDVGCGTGYLLEYAKSRGFSVEGVEPNIDAANYANRTLGGCPIKTGEYKKEIFPAGSFDLITVIHVIDHVMSPKSLLETAQYHLKPGGYLFVATHNMASLLSLLTGKNFIAYHVQHIAYFTPRLLRAMMRICGLTPVKTLGSVTTYPLAHYIENGVKNRPLREHIIKCLKKINFDKIKVSLPMGNMEVIGKKV